jgi:NADPH:quinone reductase-like Zn-dependent oxidoreductase
MQPEADGRLEDERGVRVKVEDGPEPRCDGQPMALRDLIESGAVTPAIDRAYPLSDTPAAIRRLAAGDARGKIVITA